MACSKIFSGNLPEVTNHIIQYLQKDLKSLYSCVLVNRLLCRIATPMLWEDPFSVKCRDGYPYNFLDTYLTFFNENDQTKLRDFGIIIDSPFKKPLFNYPSFIKTLNTYRIELHTVNWMNNLDILPDNPSSNQVKSNKITFFSTYDFFEIKINLLEPKKAMDFICISLFKLFMNNDVSLNNLNIFMDDYHGIYLFGVFKLILNNSKFISDIENFTFSLSCVPMEQKFGVQHFLTSLPPLLSSIKQLDIHVDNESFLEISTDLIQSQTQLLSLTLHSITSNVLDAFKYCSNTLTSIEFLFCNFCNILSFDGLKYLTQLKSLQFIQCQGLTTQVFQPLLDIPTLKIRSLKVNSQILAIDLLLQKVGSYLEHLELRLDEDTEREKAFESIINYCDKIQFLYLSNISLKNIPRLYELIIHINRHLKYLSLQNKFYYYQYNENNLKISSMILKGLGQRLPDSLEYLDLYFTTVDPNDLKTFLDNCKHVGLNKLLVKNDNNINIDTIFNVLKRFVRENDIKNFAYRVNRSFDPEDSKHCKLEELVKETQPFVKIMRYDDLVVRFSDITNLNI